MEKFLFMRPLLQRLGDGRFCYRTVAITLRVVAAVIVMFSLVTFFSAGRLIFDLPSHAILGGVMFEVFFVLAIYATVHVLLLRAADVERLEAHEYFALPLGAKLVQLVGEAYAAFVSFVAFGAGAFVAFTNMSPSKVLNPLIRSLFPSLREDTTLMGGIEFVASGLLVAFGALVLAYVLSQLLALAGRMGRPAASVATARPMGEHSQGFRSRFG
jgi:hypothetical protein